MGFRLLLPAALSLLTACSSSGLIAPDESPYAPYPTRAESTISQMELGHRLMGAQEHELALRAFTRAAGEEGLTAEVLMAMGTANLGLGRLGQAEKQLRQAYDKDQTSPDILNNLGVVLMERGKDVEAAQLFRTAFALDNGNSVEIRDNLRKALANLENPGYTYPQDEAMKLVRKGSSEYHLSEFP
ncbi:MAG: tetratricopeptide repeat protein [Pseudomonadota bacterium]